MNRINLLSRVGRVASLVSRDSEQQQRIERRLPELARLERLLRYLLQRDSVHSGTLAHDPGPGGSVGEDALVSDSFLSQSGARSSSKFSAKSNSAVVRVRVENTVSHDGIDFPLYSVVLGSQEPTAPTLGIFGGVHGLERIGSEVALACLQTVAELSDWDGTFKERLEHSRLVFMPIVNPVGMFLTRRANGNGVDLMRNAPVVAEEEPAFLLGGQTYSRYLPWYRGQTGEVEAENLNGADRANLMEPEARALCDVVAREIFPAKVSLAVDVHSGFGSVDRLWFPYAKTQRPPPNLEEIMALKKLFDRSYPNHFYRIEPQAQQYTTHGDLWDWLYDQKLERASEGLFLPWALELGSWLWLKKNPRQLFSSLGPFNPILPHRQRRILRRHLTLFDFLHRAVLNADHWTEMDDLARSRLREQAIELWYRNPKSRE